MLMPATESTSSTRSMKVSLHAVATKAKIIPKSNSKINTGSITDNDGMIPRAMIWLIGSRVVMVLPKFKIVM